MNKTITASATFSEEQIAAFADFIGYKAEIPGTEINPVNLRPDFIENPQSREDFVAEKFNEACLNFITPFATAQISAAVAQAKVNADAKAAEEIAQVQAGLTQAITVSIT